MKKLLFFDCFSGISGDMILGALFSLKPDYDGFVDRLRTIGLDDLFSISIYNVMKSGISAYKVDVEVRKGGVRLKKLKDVFTFLDKTALSNSIIEKAKTIFLKIAKAEGLVHGKDVESIHFHEVGQIDALVDVVGSLILLDMIDVDIILSSPINIGGGFINISHGIYPGFAPATSYILQGIPIYSTGVKDELVTPTGAAIISSIAMDFVVDIPLSRFSNIGYGAGSKDFEKFPNVLRVFYGELLEDLYDEDSVIVLEANIDDMNPEFFEYVFDKLFEAGAYDVYLSNIMMKKLRPGIKLSVITPKEAFYKVLNIVIKETSTIGVRYFYTNRKKLKRESVGIDTKYGEVKVKIGKLGDKIVNIAPEYESCKELSKKIGLPLKSIYIEALSSARERYSSMLEESKGVS